MKIGGVLAMALLGTSLVLAIPARAGTIAITYSFSGGLTAAPDLEPDGLHLQASANGQVSGPNPAVNAAWNPVTFDTKDVLDFSTGLDNGVFTWTFANGATLSGTMFEDDTAVDFATNSGPYFQALTFTSGTGIFAGVGGAASGDGFLDAPNFTISGSGYLTAPGLVSVPEPGTLPLMFGAGTFGAMVLRRRKASVRKLQVWT